VDMPAVDVRMVDVPAVRVPAVDVRMVDVPAASVPAVAVRAAASARVVVAAAAVRMVMPAVRGPGGRRRRRIGHRLAGRRRGRAGRRPLNARRGPPRPTGPRAACPAIRSLRRGAHGDRLPGTRRAAVGRRRIGAIRNRGVGGARRHHRLDGHCPDHATGAAREAASDEDSRQHGSHRREDARQDPLTPEHSRCIPGSPGRNRAFVRASPFSRDLDNLAPIPGPKPADRHAQVVADGPLGEKQMAGDLAGGVVLRRGRAALRWSYAAVPAGHLDIQEDDVGIVGERGRKHVVAPPHLGHHLDVALAGEQARQRGIA